MPRKPKLHPGNGSVFAWLCAALMVSIAGCASTPAPVGLLNEAEAALERAVAAGADEHAPIELRFAREKLAGARLSMQERNHPRARRLAEQSIINAELAVAKTGAARARSATRAQQLANEELRERLGSEDGS